MTFVLHTNGPISIGESVIGGITSLGSALGSQVRSEATSGEVLARVTALMSQKPTATFTTEDVQAALSACGPMGCDLFTKNLKLYGSKLLSGGRIADSGHVSLTAALGVLVPQSLNCSHQGNASISYQAHVLSDGDDAAPWTLSTAATLPTVSAANLWTLSSATVGGVAIDQHTQLGVEFGLNVLTEGSSSNIRDSIATIRSITPRITLTSSKQGDALENFMGLSGAFSLVLRQRKTGGTFENLSITLSGTCYAFQEQPIVASGQGSAHTQLMAHVQWDGNNDPISYVFND